MVNEVKGRLLIQLVDFRQLLPVDKEHAEKPMKNLTPSPGELYPDKYIILFQLVYKDVLKYFLLTWFGINQLVENAHSRMHADLVRGTVNNVSCFI